MESKQHEDIARRIARSQRAAYNSTKGPDIVTRTRVTEVGVDPARVREEMGQVQRFRKARYVAGPRPFVKAAVEATKGTGIGVMDGRGRIVKRARRRKQ